MKRWLMEAAISDKELESALTAEDKAVEDAISTAKQLLMDDAPSRPSNATTRR